MTEQYNEDDICPSTIELSVSFFSIVLDGRRIFSQLLKKNTNVNEEYD